MKKIQLIIIIALFIRMNGVIAQTSLLQDKAGETSITTNSAKTLFVNAGDANITFALPFTESNSKGGQYFIGLDARFKANGGVSQIIEGFELKPQIDAGFFGGTYFKSKPSVISYWFAGAKINNSSFNLLVNDNSNAYESEDFTGYSLSLGYNRVGSISILKKPNPAVTRRNRLPSSYILGIAAKFARSNNLEDLRLVDITTTRTVNNNSNNTQSTVTLQKRSAYNGDFEVLEALRINLDTYIYPQVLGGRFGIGGFYRGQLTGRYQRSNAGFGFIVGQEDAPSNIILGVFYQANDIFNQLNEEPLFIKRTGLTLNAGYSF